MFVRFPQNKILLCTHLLKGGALKAMGKQSDFESMDGNFDSLDSISERESECL